MAGSSAAEQLFGDLRATPGPIDRRPDTRVSNDLGAMADAAAERHGIDPRFFRGVIHTESSWNPGALGPVTKSGERAVGLGQVMPSTAAGEGYNPADLADPEVNLDASAKYLSKMLVMAKGDHNLAARMYNAGPAGNLDHPEVAAYADKVFTNARRYDDTGPTPDLFRGFSSGLNSALNDSTTGLSGYSASAQGFDDDAAASYAAYRDRQRELDDQARPQDRSFTEAVKGGAGEFFGDYLPYTIGNALGSSAPSLGSAAAGAGAGFMVAGPPGAAVGAIAGGAIPLLTQYLGSTWGENTAEKLAQKGINPDQASLDQIQAASGMTASEFARVTGAAIGRAGLEGAGEMFLGGFGGKLVSKAEKLLPKGAAKKATDLLSNTVSGRVAGAALGEGVTEMGDVPLSDIGSGRAGNGKWSGAQEYGDAFMGGVVGGGGARGGYEAARNPAATLGAVQQGITNTVNNTQWGQERYRNKMGSTIDSVVQGQVDAQNEQDKARADAEAERLRIPSVEELHARLVADWQAEVDRRKPQKVTEADYHAEVDRLAADGLSADEITAENPHLASFAAYKKWVTAQQKAQSKDNPLPEKPGRIDAIRYRQSLLAEQAQNAPSSGNTEFSPELVQRGQRQGWKPSPSARAATQAASDRFVSENTPATPLLPNYSAEDSLRRAKEAQRISDEATDPNEKAAYAKMAQALQDRAIEQATPEGAQRFGMKALMDGQQDEASFWFDIAEQKKQTPPSAQSLQDVETARQNQRGQVESAQRAVETGDAARQNMVDERNQAYDALESQQAAEKEAQFLEMERQRNLAQAAEPVFDPGALINQKPGLQWKSRPEKKAEAPTPTRSTATASSKPIAGKKLESGYQGGRSSIDLMSSESGSVAPTRRTNSTVTRTSQITPEAAAVLAAQEKVGNRLENLRDQIEQNKQSMLAKAIAALKKQGAQIEEGDRLQWKDNAWSLFPPNFRGRPPTGYFYADIFNEAGDKIGKVLRPNQPTPPTPPTPPEETGNAENTAGSNSSNGKQEGQSKPRRKNSRRVSVSEAQGQSEANDASQGSEVGSAEQKSEASQADGGSSSQSEVRKGSGRSRKSRKGVQSGGQENGNAQEETESDVDALIKKIGDMQDKKAKRQRLEDRAGEADTDTTSSLDDFRDLFSRSLDGTWRYNDFREMVDIKGFLTRKSQAEQKKNPTTVRDILQHYLSEYPEGEYRELAETLLRIPVVASVPISYGYTPEEGALGVFRTATGSIEVFDRANWQTVLHEIVHAATIKGMASDEKLAQEIWSLWEQAVAAAEKAGIKEEHYGLTDPLEFLAEAFTNDDFKAFLKTLSVEAEGKPLPAWKRLVNAIASFFGRAGRFTPTKDNVDALSKVMSLGNKAIELTGKNSDVRVDLGDAELNLYRKDFKEFTDKVLDTSLGELVGKGADTINNLIVGMNNTAFLAKWFPNMESLQAIHNSETKMQASQGKNANATMDKVDDIRNLQKQDRTKLFTLMVDSTRERMHPDRALDDKTNAHIPVTPESEAIHRKLKAQFNALSPDARKAYQETRDLFQTMFDQRTKALFALSDRILTEKKRTQFKENIDRLVKGMPGPYFPLTRFGNYVAVWKSKEYAKAQKDNDTKALEKLKSDPNHYAVSFHGSSFQAKQALKKMVAKMGDRSALGENESYAREREFYDGGVTMDLQPLLEKMQDAVETTLGKENAKEAKDALAEIFVSSLADTNVLKSTLKRENVEGVKPEEMLQAIARHGSAQAFHISRLEHMADIQDALKKLRNEDSVEVNKGQRFSLYNTVAKALTGMYTGDPTSFPVRMINGANFLLYNGRLALNPAFWITNAMAPLVVSVPYMRGRFKVNSVLEAYRQAAIDAGKVVMPKGLKDATRFSLLDAITEAKGLKAGEREMLLELMDEGLIDENQIRELSNVAQGNIGVKDDLARYLGAIPHRVEALNRVSTALAAYRLELAKTKDQAAATRYAIETTSETQVNYTTAGTPYILRKNGWLGAPAAKILTQFVRYQLGMVQLIGHNFREAWVSKSVSNKTREEARRKFYALLSMHTAMTGASGWFGASAFMAVAQMITNAFREDDDEVDLEQEAKKLADDIFGKELSVGIRKGLPAMAGLDLSSRLGMGDMLSIRKENPFRGDAREAKANLVDMAPAVSNLFEWYGWARGGFPMKKVPVSFISNLAKAGELADKGMVNTHGVVKKGAEDFTKTDIVLQGFGFTPTESTEAYAAQNATREKEKAVGTARETLIDDWNNAVSDNDKEAVADARKKITEFNARHKGQRDIQITPDTLTKSRKQRLARQKRMNEYGVYVPKGGQWRNNMTNAEE